MTTPKKAKSGKQLIQSGRHKQQKERGSSLMEVLFATMVVSVGLLSVAQLFSVAAALNINSKNTTRMARAAQKELEHVRAKTYANMSNETIQTTPSSGLKVTMTTELVRTGLKKTTVTVEDSTTYVAKANQYKASIINYRTDTTTAFGALYNGAARPSGTQASPTPTPTSTATPTPTPTPTPAATPTPTPTPTSPQVCQYGERPSQTGCSCQSPMRVLRNGTCK